MNIEVKEYLQNGEYEMLYFAKIRTVNFAGRNLGFKNNTKGRMLELLTTYGYSIFNEKIADQETIDKINIRVSELKEPIKVWGYNSKFYNVKNGEKYKIIDSFGVEVDDINDNKFLESKSDEFKISVFERHKEWLKCNNCGAWAKIYYKYNGITYTNKNKNCRKCCCGKYNFHFIEKHYNNFNNQKEVIDFLLKRGLVYIENNNKVIKNKKRPDHYILKDTGKIHLIEDKNKEDTEVTPNDVLQLLGYGKAVKSIYGGEVKLKMIHSGIINPKAQNIINYTNTYGDINLSLISYREMLKAISIKSGKSIIGLIYTKTPIEIKEYKSLNIDFLDTYAEGYYYVCYMKDLIDEFANSDNIRFFICNDKKDNIKALKLSYEDFLSYTKK